ncbi:MAG: hypothetical protein AAFQ80_10955 [Cyanobacteria bacterium J06621_8]
MKIIQANYLWLFGFSLMFFLALDFWSWQQPVTLSEFNFPGWIFYFVGLQLTLAIAIAVFAITFWQQASDEERLK